MRWVLSLALILAGLAGVAGCGAQAQKPCPHDPQVQTVRGGATKARATRPDKSSEKPLAPKHGRTCFR